MGTPDAAGSLHPLALPHDAANDVRLTMQVKAPHTNPQVDVAVANGSLRENVR